MVLPLASILGMAAKSECATLASSAILSRSGTHQSPQMRAPLDCPRERSPVVVRVELDGKPVIDESFPPAGLNRDGASAGYRRLPIPAGRHTVRARLSDDTRSTDFPYERTAELEVKPGQIVLIDFNPAQGGVLIR